jgi:hypothetical protein
MPSQLDVDKIRHTNGTDALTFDTSGNTNLKSAVIEGSSSGNLVRITQTGTGNALVVEDSANPDATPFVVNASGKIGVGVASPIALLDLASNAEAGALFSSYANSAAGKIELRRATGTIASPSIVSNGQTVGQYGFSAYDGTGFIEAARIRTEVDGTPGANDMPGRLIFSTTANGASSVTERMRIDSSGNVGINTAPDSNSKLHILDDTSSLDDYTIQIESYTPAIVLHDISGASTDFAIQVDGSALMFRYGDASTGTQLASEAMRIDSSGLVYQEGNTNQSVKTKSIMARWGSMIMSKIVSTGSCNGSGASITWESININGDNRQIFASSSTGTPSGYLAITDAEGRFPIILVDCGGFMQLEISSTIPSFWGRVYVRDDISFAASFS